MSVVDLTLNNIANYLAQEFIKAIGVPGEIKEIGKRLESLKSFLVDAENFESPARRENIKQWVKSMEDAAHEAQDILDHHSFDARRHDLRGQAKRALYISNISISMRIDNLNKKLNKIVEDRDLFRGLPNDDDLGESVAGRADRRRNSPSDQLGHRVSEDEVVGFKDVTAILMRQLLDHQSTPQLCTVSIVGLGGLGKSTISWKAYRSHHTQLHFNFQIWICVSQNCVLSYVLKKILEAKRSKIQSSKQYDFADEKEMIKVELIDQVIQFLLQQGRYLIVLDDVWQTGLWERLRAALPDIGDGSRVLLTTRSLVVAKETQTRFVPHQLRLLDDHESEQLLKMKALRPGETYPASELDVLIPQLARKCSGLPLALVEVGALLAKQNKTHGIWKRILDQYNWQMEGESCMKVLAKSYRNLPHNIKPCFLYLATFPLDYEISAGILFKLWIAEGFISGRDAETYEDTAEKYLEHLVDMSLLHVVKKKSHNGSVKTCRVHHLLHELARSEAAKGRIVHVVSSNQTTQDEARRLAVHGEMIDPITEHDWPNLRTFAAFSGSLWPDFHLICFRLLKVLELSNVTNLQNLPPVITNLVLLKYIGLRYTKSLRDLPRSMYELENLQTLDMKGSAAAKVPTKLWEIKSLRHVRFSSAMTDHHPTAPPISTSCNRNLRTLIGISATSAALTMGMTSFANLRKLKVFMIDDATIHMIQVLLANLKKLVSLKIQANKIQFTRPCTLAHENLRSLYLQGQWMPISDGTTYMQLAPEKVEFPRHLSKLKLIMSQLNRDPMPWLGELTSLKVLTLDRAYIGEHMECSMSGCFPELKELKVSNLYSLKCWQIPRNPSMPKLNSLSIDSCTKLTMLPDLHHVPRLQVLRLVSMPQEFGGRIMLQDQDGYKVCRISTVLYQETSSAREIPIKAY